MAIVKEVKVRKLTVKIDSSKIDKFVTNIIKDYKLTSSKGDYTYDQKTFVLFNTNQYNFTDIRNEIFRKKIDYEEL
jgi:hypothetical protein